MNCSRVLMAWMRVFSVCVLLEERFRRNLSRLPSIVLS